MTPGSADASRCGSRSRSPGGRRRAAPERPPCARAARRRSRPLRAVPVVPVAEHLEERRGHLVGRGLDLLQAHDVGLIARDPVAHLRLARADAVDVPGGDRQASRRDEAPVDRRRARGSPRAPSRGRAPRGTSRGPRRRRPRRRPRGPRAAAGRSPPPTRRARAPSGRPCRAGSRRPRSPARGPPTAATISDSASAVGIDVSSWRPPWLETQTAATPSSTARGPRRRRARFP